MRILLFGATGMIGSRIAAEALNRGHEITGATRSGTGGTLAADASDPDAVARLSDGHDAVILAVREPGTEALLAVGRGAVDGLRKSGVHRVILVGGAGSLQVAPGVRVVDTLAKLDVPEDVRQQVHAQVALLGFIRDNAGDLEWTYFSPAAEIEPGDRTGTYRPGSDKLLSDGQGRSHISAEDYAVALLDELERGQHIREQITAAY